MIIETTQRRRVLVTVTDDELCGYGIDFGSMCLADHPTRTMLDDMLALLEHMGLRSAGQRVTVECTRCTDGGIRLLFVLGQHYRFACFDDVLAAYRAGALPDCIDSVTCVTGGVALCFGDTLTDSQHCTLSEFCDPVAC